MSPDASAGSADADAVPPATILVVDDSSIGRTKLRLAVRKLGHSADVAEDGEAALRALAEKPYDAVLLDIVMPGIDGFDVLSAMKANEELRDIPVIVISALDDDPDSVVRAILLGAEDFLPKEFDSVLLNARLGASLSKKRFRDKEREYFRRVDRLTAAAERLESGRFGLDDLDFDDLTEHNDPLGRLAAVFRGMAAEIYERERRLQNTIKLLQGSLLVLACGVVWGSSPALARLASDYASNPLGMAVWVNGFAAIVYLAIAAYRGRLPKLTLSDLQFFCLWAIVAGVMQRLTIFFVAEHVEASLLVLIATLQSFFFFIFAAVTKLEQTTPRRLFGILLGFGGICLALSAQIDGSSNGAIFWIGIALILPLLYVVEWALMAAKRPTHIDAFASVGIMMAISTIFLLPVVFLFGAPLALNLSVSPLEGLVAVMGLAAGGSVVIALYLVATAGAVFASQSAYVMTIAGIVWGMLLLDEALTATAWIAVALILVGLYFVGTKISDDKVTLRRSLAVRGRNS